MNSNDMKNIFIKKFGQEFSNKVKLVLFGSLETVCEKLIYKKPTYRKIGQEFLAKKGVEVNRFNYVVKLGYSGHEPQQHIEILENLNILSGEFKSQLLIIIPMTYGATIEYIDRVQESFKDSDLNVLIIEKYMTDDESLGLSDRTLRLAQI